MFGIHGWLRCWEIRSTIIKKNHWTVHDANDVMFHDEELYMYRHVVVDFLCFHPWDQPISVERSLRIPPALPRFLRKKPLIRWSQFLADIFIVLPKKRRFGSFPWFLSVSFTCFLVYLSSLLQACIDFMHKKLFQPRNMFRTRCPVVLWGVWSNCRCTPSVRA